MHPLGASASVRSAKPVSDASLTDGADMASLVFADVTGCYRQEPDLELQGVLKRNVTDVRFFRGTMMSAYDLERVQVRL